MLRHDFAADLEAVSVRGYCTGEGRESVEASTSAYQARIESAIGLTGYVPNVYPVRRQTAAREYVPSWIGTEDVVFEVGKDPFRTHSRGELVDFAVRNRANSSRHLSSMDDLWVKEYPTPPAWPSRYFVTINGHHRRLVFQAMGLPRTGAWVSSCQEDLWDAPFSLDSQGGALLDLMRDLGLVDSLREGANGKVRFRDPTGYVGWVLPDFNNSCPRKYGAQIALRMRQLDITFGQNGTPEVQVLRDSRRLQRKINRKLSLTVPGKIARAVRAKFEQA